MNNFVNYLYHDVVDEVDSIYKLLEIDSENDDMVIGYIVNTMLNNKRILQSLYKLRNYHLQTYKHCIRVGVYSLFIMDNLGINSKEFDTIFMASIMHDIGKMHVPKCILDKRGKLNEYEFEIIKSHSKYSSCILRDLGCTNDVCMLVLSHHESPKGGGYPSGNINCNFYSQIVSVCDIFDALTSKRAYKKAFSIDESIKIISESMFNERIYYPFIKVNNRVG